MTVPVYAMTDTWNDNTKVFNAIQMTITDLGHLVGSASVSLVNGTTQFFSIDSVGIFTWPDKSLQFQAGQQGIGGQFTFTNTGSISDGPYIKLIGTQVANSLRMQVALNTDSSGRCNFGMDGNGTPVFGFGPGTASRDTVLFRVAGAVLGVGQNDGPASAADAWFQWAGLTRVTADVSFTSNTTLGTVTGLSVNVQAGRTYSFEAYLSWTDAAAGGIKAAIAGTCTATAIEYDGYIIDSAANGIKGNAQATALGTTVASATTTGTAGVVMIQGTITVNAAGTLLVQAAQNTSSGTATTIKRGSRFWVYDMP